MSHPIEDLRARVLDNARVQRTTQNLENYLASCVQKGGDLAMVAEEVRQYLVINPFNPVI